jgi:hypothetical protein
MHFYVDVTACALNALTYQRHMLAIQINVVH